MVHAFHFHHMIIMVDFDSDSDTTLNDFSVVRRYILQS